MMIKPMKRTGNQLERAQDGVLTIRGIVTVGRVWLPWVDWGEQLHKSTYERRGTRHTVSVDQSEPVCGDVEVTQGIHGGDIRKTSTLR